MEKLKQAFFSENGMKIVNLLFLFSFVIRNRGVIFIAYIAWIIYLSFCIKHTAQVISKTVYKFLIAYAFLIIAANVYFYITLT